MPVYLAAAGYDANAAFVAATEDVLEVYHCAHDARRPLVCLDETSKQLIPRPVSRSPCGRPAGAPRYEYERGGTGIVERASDHTIGSPRNAKLRSDTNDGAICQLYLIDTPLPRISSFPVPSLARKQCVPAPATARAVIRRAAKADSTARSASLVTSEQANVP